MAMGMNDLKGPPSELRCTVTIKRAATGKEETYELVGQATPEQVAALIGAADNEQPKEQ
jgi:hypothetical protein